MVGLEDQNEYNFRISDERLPGGQGLQNHFPAAFRVGDPTAVILGKHVVPHVVHDLDALDFGVDVQGLADFLANGAPGPALHAAGCVDDEDDILAVHRDAAHRGAGLRGAPGGQAFPGFGQINEGFLQGIAGQDQLFFAFEHLIFNAVGFSAEFSRNRLASGGTFGVDEDEQQNDRPDPQVIMSRKDKLKTFRRLRFIVIQAGNQLELFAVCFQPNNLAEFFNAIRPLTQGFIHKDPVAAVIIQNNFRPRSPIVQ